MRDPRKALLEDYLERVSRERNLCILQHFRVSDDRDLHILQHFRSFQRHEAVSQLTHQDPSFDKPQKQGFPVLQSYLFFGRRGGDPEKALLEDYLQEAKSNQNTRLLHFFVLPDSQNEPDHETVVFLEASRQQNHRALRILRHFRVSDVCLKCQNT